MPIASPEVYAEMLDRAKAGHYAYPAINCTSSQTIVAAIRGFAEAESDASCRSPGAAPSSPPAQRLKDMVLGRRLSPSSRTSSRPCTTSTSPCTPTTVPPTSLTASCGRWSTSRSSGWPAARPRCSSRTCGTGRPSPDREPRRRAEMLDKCQRAHIVMELEIGVVGGEEDGVEASTTPSSTPRPTTRSPPPRSSGWASVGATCCGDLRQRARRLQAGQRRASPSILKDLQDAVAAKYSSARAPSRSTWSSTEALVPCCPRSARPSTTASSR